MSVITEQNRMCDEALALLGDLPRTEDGWARPPRTTNRVRPAHSTERSWGWTHYFLLANGEVHGAKLPDNLVFVNRWAYDSYGPGTFHLGRAVPRPDTGQFVFEAWPFPIS